MAVIAPTIVTFNTDKDHCHLVTWGPIAAGDTCTPVEMAGEADRSVQMEGTFGGTISMKGSNDRTNFHTLSDPLGAPLDFVAANLKQISEISTQIKPVPAAGVTAVIVTMLTRRPTK